MLFWTWTRYSRTLRQKGFVLAASLFEEAQIHVPVSACCKSDLDALFLVQSPSNDRHKVLPLLFLGLESGLFEMFRQKGNRFLLRKRFEEARFTF